MFGDFILDFAFGKLPSVMIFMTIKCSYPIVSLRITIESVLTPVQYKNHTEICRSNVKERPLCYKTCDNTVATTNMFY